MVLSHRVGWDKFVDTGLTVQLDLACLPDSKQKSKNRFSKIEIMTSWSLTIQQYFRFNVTAEVQATIYNGDLVPIYTLTTRKQTVFTVFFIF